jgi:hypothetical protein
VEVFATRAGSTSASTIASGRLAEWFELGGVATSAVRDNRGIGTMSQGSGSESRRVWVKVETLD